jgi:hypothetical protein
VNRKKVNLIGRDVDSIVKFINDVVSKGIYEHIEQYKDSSWYTYNNAFNFFYSYDYRQKNQRWITKTDGKFEMAKIKYPLILEHNGKETNVPLFFRGEELWIPYDIGGRSFQAIGCSPPILCFYKNKLRLVVENNKCECQYNYHWKYVPCVFPKEWDSIMLVRNPLAHQYYINTNIDSSKFISEENSDEIGRIIDNHTFNDEVQKRILNSKGLVIAFFLEAVCVYGAHWNALVSKYADFAKTLWEKCFQDKNEIKILEWNHIITTISLSGFSETRWNSEKLPRTDDQNIIT